MCGRPLQGQEGCADGMKWLSAVLAPWLGMLRVGTGHGKVVMGGEKCMQLH